MKKPLFNKALRLLLVTNGLVLLSGAMLGPIYALFVDGIGGDLLDASLTGGIFALAAGITSLISGKFADKLKRPEKIVTIGYFGMGVGFLMYMFVGSIYMLFLVQVVIGISEAIYSPAFDAIYSKHLAKTKRGREWGAWETINYFSIATGSMIGGIIAKGLGFNFLFWIMATFCFFGAITIYFSPKKLL